jgi:hypothetical protein
MKSRGAIPSHDIPPGPVCIANKSVMFISSGRMNPQKAIREPSSASANHHPRTIARAQQRRERAISPREF